MECVSASRRVDKQGKAKIESLATETPAKTTPAAAYAAISREFGCPRHDG
jgi:hypothetical protein